MELLDIVKKESGCSFYCDHYVCRNEVYSLGNGIYDSHDNIMSRELWEFDHKIDTERIPLSQMVTYLVCDELKYGFKSAYEQS